MEMMAAGAAGSVAPRSEPVPDAAPRIERGDFQLPNRHEVNMGGFAFVLHNVFTPEECEELLPLLVSACVGGGEIFPLLIEWTVTFRSQG